MARTLLLVSLENAEINEYRHGFAAEGFSVACAYQADHAEAMAVMHSYNAILIFSPSAEPIRLLVSHLSESDWFHPVVMCITTVDTKDEINLLERGAVACRAWGISFAELLAQTRALLNRVQGYPRHYRVADLGIDPIARKASRQGIPLALRPVEFDLLLRLAETKGEVVSKESLIASLWPSGNGSPNHLAVHVRNLRTALGGQRQPRLIHTVRNLGYVLCQPHQTRSRNRSRGIHQMNRLSYARPATW